VSVVVGEYYLRFAETDVQMTNVVRTLMKMPITKSS
jgi:hypothetical protein